MNLERLKVRFTMKKIYIECRECNTFFEIDEKNQKFICPMCKYKEDLVVIDKKKTKKRINR